MQSDSTSGQVWTWRDGTGYFSESQSRSKFAFKNRNFVLEVILYWELSLSLIIWWLNERQGHISGTQNSSYLMWIIAHSTLHARYGANNEYCQWNCHGVLSLTSIYSIYKLYSITVQELFSSSEKMRITFFCEFTWNYDKTSIYVISGHFLYEAWPLLLCHVRKVPMLHFSVQSFEQTITLFYYSVFNLLEYSAFKLPPITFVELLMNIWITTLIINYLEIREKPRKVLILLLGVLSNWIIVNMVISI